MARGSPSASAVRAMPSAPTASSIHFTSGPGKPFRAASSSPVSSTTTGLLHALPGLPRLGAQDLLHVERLDLRQIERDRLERLVQSAR